MSLSRTLRLGCAATLVTGAFCLIGCTTRFTDFTMLSTKNIDLSRAAEFKRGTTRVVGEDVAYIIIFIPTGMPQVKEAIDRAIEKVPGAIALVDGVVSARAWYFLFGESAYVVEGTPLIDPALAGTTKLPSNYIVSYFEPQADTPTVKYVDQDRFLKIRATARQGDGHKLAKLLMEQP